MRLFCFTILYLSIFSTAIAGKFSAFPLNSAQADDSFATLTKNVEDFEKFGGKGQWFKSIPPFDDDQQLDNDLITGGQSYYLIKTLPEDADPNCGFYACREETYLSFAKEMLSKGATVVIGYIDEGKGVAGAAIPKSDYRLYYDAENITHSNHKSVMLLTPTSTKDTAVHEFQHWNDFDSGILTEFENKLKPFLESQILDENDFAGLIRIVTEIRGYSRAILSLREGKEQNLPWVNNAGSIISDSSQLKIAYLVHEKLELTGFNAYPSWLYMIMNKVKNKSVKDYRKIGKLLSQYDFSSEYPKFNIVFKNLLHD